MIRRSSRSGLQPLRGSKLGNDYQATISPRLYARTPKAVFAAIAVSLLSNHGGIEFDAIDAGLVEEWATLNANGIVPQRPPQ